MPFLKDRPENQGTAGMLPHQKADVDLVLLDHLLNLEGLVGPHIEVERMSWHSGDLPVKRPEDECIDAVDACDGQTPLGRPILEPFGILCQQQPAFGQRDKGLAPRGQLNAAPALGTDNQRFADRLLKQFETVADGGLREMQLLRRPGDASQLCDF